MERSYSTGYPRAADPVQVRKTGSRSGYAPDRRQRPGTVADEMATTIFRTAHSTVVRDAMDFSAALCGATGETIAQAVTIPLQLGSIPNVIKVMFERFGDDFRPGDIYIVNDPFDGASHTPDIFIVKPVFFQGERIGFAVTVAHHGDIGGRVPGTIACDSTDVFQEGLRIPWVRLYESGAPVETVFKFIQANCRIPREIVGDLNAQVSACMIGDRGLCDLAERYGVADLADMMSGPPRPHGAAPSQRDRQPGPTAPSSSPTSWTRTESTSWTCRSPSGLTIRGDELIADFTRVGTDGARRAELHAVVRRGDACTTR